MDRGLSWVELLILISYAVGLAVGQALFKTAALQQPVTGSLGQRAVSLMFNPTFMVAIILYALLSVIWVWVLAIVPLSRAYPFVALAFVLTLGAGVVLFGEPLSGRLVLGSVLVIGGLLTIVT